MTTIYGNITLKLPETAFAVLRKSPAEFAQAMKIAALVKWHEQGLVSQSKAAEIAGVSRREFLEQLFVHHTSPYQLDAGELEDELD